MAGGFEDSAETGADTGAGPSSAPALPAAQGEAPAGDPSAKPPYTHTRASGVWAAVVVALLVLLALLVFILENGAHVKVSLFGAHTSLPLGVALLLAAVFGGLVVVLAGTARILQLRRRARLGQRTTGAGQRGRSHRRGRGGDRVVDEGQ